MSDRSREKARRVRDFCSSRYMPLGRCSERGEAAHGTRPAPEAHESQGLRGATPPRHRPRRSGRFGDAGAGVVPRDAMRINLGKVACQDRDDATAVPAEARGAGIRWKKARKEGGNSAFARFCSLLCDGRTECMQRPAGGIYLLLPLSSPDAGSLFISRSPERSTRGLKFMRAAVHASQ